MKLLMKNAGVKIASFMKRHLKAVIILFVILFVGIVALKAYRDRQDALKRKEMPQITTETIERQTLSNSISITGTIAANDSQTVYSNNSGCEVVSMNVVIGDRVKKGDVICILDSSDYEDEIADLEKNMAIASQKASLNVTEAQRSLSEATADAATDIERAQGKVDDAVEDYNGVASDKSKAYNDYLEACEDTEDAKDAREKAKKKMKNAKEDYGEESQEYEEAKAAYNTKDSAYDAAKKAEEAAYDAYLAYDDKIQSAIRNYESALESQQDANTQAGRNIQNKTDNLTNSNLEASTANDDNEKKLENYQKLIDKCTVTAPISGIVTSIKMEVGDEIANDNNEICVIQDDSSYKVEADVDQYDISNIYEGMTAVIKTDATDDLEMEGMVTFVSPTPGTSTGTGSSAGSSSGSSSTSSTTYPVEISIKQADEKIRIGMTAETSLLTETAENVLAVPYDCITENENGESVIYVIDDGSTSDDSSKVKVINGDSSIRNDNNTDNYGGRQQKEIVVKTGLETDYYTEIISDEIKEGMQVVVPNSITKVSEEGNENEMKKTSGVISIEGGPGGTGGNPGGMGGRPGF